MRLRGGGRTEPGSEPAGEVAGTFQARILGPLAVSRDGIPLDVSRWRRGSGRLFLALAISPDHRRFRRDLIHLLWPGSAGRDAGPTNLRVALHELRKGLGGGQPTPVLTEGGWVALSPAYAWEIDLDRFHALLEQGDEIRSLEDALDLLPTGMVLGQLDEDWLRERRDGVERQARDAVLRLAQLYRRHSQPDAAVNRLQWWLERHPLDEDVLRHLLDLYASMGRGAEGLRRYERFVTHLQERERRPPTAETEALLMRLRALSGVARPSAPRPPSNLPAPVTSFVGREQEIQQVTELLLHSQMRLLTLTGPPGVGKTRLALEAAGLVHQRFREGSFLVPLAPIGRADLVASALMGALGIRETPNTPPAQALTAYLREKELLLLLDNFEHLPAAATLVSHLLRSCPSLTILVTSREPLHLYGEHEVTVSPLRVPEGNEGAGTIELLGYGAVALFAHRATAARSDFRLTRENGPAVSEICKRLDGLPLAIELAAARLRTVSLEDVLSQLAHPLPLLAEGPIDADPRHRTLRATLDWSYHLLPSQEQALFRWLSVFAGGCTPGAIASVIADAHDGIDLERSLQSLVDKHLLRREGESLSRFAMLQTIREYAADNLQQEGEEDAAREAHAQYFLNLAEEADEAIETPGPSQYQWLSRLDLELDNLREALHWLLEHGKAEVELRLAVASSGFLRRRGHVREARRWIEAGLAACTGITPGVRARALGVLGGLAISRGDYEQAVTFLEESLTLYRAVGDQERSARALGGLGTVAFEQGQYDRATALLQEELAAYHLLGDRGGRVRTLANLGVVAAAQGEFLTAKERLGEALAFYREVGDALGVAFVLANLGDVGLGEAELSEAEASYEESLAHARQASLKHQAAVALRGLGEVALKQGKLQQARERLRESFLLVRELESVVPMLEVARGLATLAAAEGRAEQAARLKGAEAAERENRDIPVLPADMAQEEETVAQIKSLLDDHTFNRSWQRGRAMSLEEAIAYALSEMAGRSVGI